MHFAQSYLASIKLYWSQEVERVGRTYREQNKEVENMLVLITNLDQIENGLIRVEFTANEIECKHQAESRRLEVAADEVACKH